MAWVLGGLRSLLVRALFAYLGIVVLAIFGLAAWAFMTVHDAARIAQAIAALLLGVLLIIILVNLWRRLQGEGDEWVEYWE